MAAASRVRAARTDRHRRRDCRCSRDSKRSHSYGGGGCCGLPMHCGGNEGSLDSEGRPLQTAAGCCTDNPGTGCTAARFGDASCLWLAADGGDMVASESESDKSTRAASSTESREAPVPIPLQEDARLLVGGDCTAGSAQLTRNHPSSAASYAAASTLGSTGSPAKACRSCVARINALTCARNASPASMACFDARAGET